MTFQTEFEFTLPHGYVDEDGNLHKDGIMRLATAADEILPLKDPRVQSNPSYLSIILLSRVITKLGTLHSINTRNIENLFIADMAYLQDLYQRINENGSDVIKTVCPKCEHAFDVEVNYQGEMLSYPLDQLLEEVAFLAYYFHWDHETIMNMEHRDRQLWCKEVSKINRDLNSTSNEKSILDM